MARKLTALTKATTIDATDLVYIVKPNAAVGTRSQGMEKANFEASLSLGSSSQSRIVSGGVVWTGTGLVYESIDLIYEINGTQFIIADNTQIALAVADPTNPRLDNIFGDDTGAIDKVTGTPGVTPVLPSIDENTQLSLTFALVGANATVPSNVSIRDVYLEDVGQPTEFDATESTGSARIDLANTTSPLTSTKDIKTIAAIVNGDTFTLTHSTATTFANFNYLRLSVRCLANWGNDFIQVRLRNGATQVALGLLNPSTMDVTDTVNTQTITLFNHQFTVPTGVEFDNIVFFNRVLGSSAILYQIDNITINEDPAATPPTTLFAADVEVDTTNFDNNLSAADDTVQKALETLDDLVVGGGSLANVVEDLTPQSGGVYDTNAFSIEWSKGADVASATELLLLRDGNYFDITGTTTITSIETSANAWKVGSIAILQFDGILTLTHHATNLILPTGANITTAAGDVAFMQKVASGDWKCVNYQRASGAALVDSGTVTSVAAGNGMNFISFTTSGAIAMGTPSTLTSSTTNATTADSHTHAITTGILDTNIVRINSITVATTEYARFTAAGLESRSAAEVLSDIGAQASGDFLTAGIADTKTAGNLNFNDNVNIVLGDGADATLGFNATDVFLDLAATTPNFRIRNAGSTVFAFARATGDFSLTGDIVQTGTQGQMDIDPFNNIRLGRLTNNAAFALNILRGDNTTTVNHKLTGVGDSYLAGNNGNVGIGTNIPKAKFHVQDADTAFSWSNYTDNIAIFEGSTDSIITIAANTNGNSSIWFADPASQSAGRLRYEHATNKMEFWTNGAEVASIDSTGNINTGGNLYAGANVYAGGSYFVFGASTGEGEYIFRSGNDVRIYAGGNAVATADGDGRRFGINQITPIAPLHVHSIDILGGVAGNYQLMTNTAISGGAGGNVVAVQEYALRDATGTSWTTWRYHNSIDVDTAFDVPGVDTRVWWERDPQHDIQSWGNAASTYMTINAGNVGINTNNPTFKLDVSGTGRFTGVLTALDGTRKTIEDYAGQARTIATTDASKVIRTTSGSPVTITVDAGSLTNIGETAEIDQYGAGLVTIAADGGTVLRVNGAASLVSSGIYSRISIQKMTDTEYRVFGELKEYVIPL